VTGRDDFPEEIRRLIDELEDRGFDVIYGPVEPVGSPGFLAEGDGAVVQVTDRVQTWFVTVITNEGRVDDSWDRPADVAHEVRRLLEAGDES
jgi:hypothetical protein